MSGYHIKPIVKERCQDPECPKWATVQLFKSKGKGRSKPMREYFCRTHGKEKAAALNGDT